MIKRQKVSKLLKKGLAVSALFCLVFTPSFSLPAQAANSTQSLVYEVYAGGIHAVQARLNINIDEKTKRYDIVLDAETRGFLKKIIPWKGVFESHGWIMPDGLLRPEHHQSTMGEHENLDIKDYRYNKDGTFKSLHVTDNHVENELRKIDKNVTDHTTDVLSSTFNMLKNYHASGKCEGKDEVFDGKRRFEQAFKHEKLEILEPSKYNIAEGTSALCSVEVTPLAGKWSEKPRGWLSIQEQGRKKGTMPTVWIGQLSQDGPAVPVKIRVKTDYGTLFMHLAEFKEGDNSKIAEKRVTEAD